MKESEIQMGRDEEEDGRFTGPLTAYRLCEGAFEKTEETDGEGDGGRGLRRRKGKDA